MYATVNHCVNIFFHFFQKKEVTFHRVITFTKTKYINHTTMSSSTKTLYKINLNT